MAKEKPKADVFVALLFVAVGALIVGITFLAVELSRYEWALPGA